MQVRVLGRVEVCGDDGAPVVMGQKLRQLVAVLALADGPVSAERLQAMLWVATRNTRNAASALTTTLNRLRQVFPDARLVCEQGGHRLVVDPEEDYLDVREFRELVASARTVRETCPERSAELLRRAVGLWRHPQLPDLPDAHATAEELRLERRDAIDALMETRMALGRHAEVAREIPALLAEDEMNDRLWLSLLLALYRDGRQGDALRAFEQARQVYLTEAGTEPGVVVRGMRDRIAADDRTLHWHPRQSVRESRAVNAGSDLTVASSTRMHDLMLGGDNHFEVDRQVMGRLLAANPDGPELARRNRAFLRRAVETLAGRGIRQFLGIGGGLPTRGNVHEVAREIVPDARVVHVDRDPVVAAEGQTTIDDSRYAAYVVGELPDLAAILAHPHTRRLLRTGEPVGVLLLCVLHFLPADEVRLSLERVREWMPPGSALAITHASRDGTSPDIVTAVDRIYRESTAERLYHRSRAEIENLFTGLELTAPLDDPGSWSTGRPLPPCAAAMLGGVALRT